MLKNQIMHLLTYTNYRVHMGKLRDFLTTSCVTKLSFLPDDSTQGLLIL